ncbi:cystathionine beta-lyase [Streptococcus ovuberis]|uniref:Cystathionine beta-lyase n=1 Tax=Streptococcus ovuberis TaxID=1936207 RepID=A0A7X6S0K5_9STRE|nr:cystathionine beta-lyase [Streptococcus ovuberis]NKZ19430.1 cystathionine beta-lyase [Streptococcus ovuberis]
MMELLDLALTYGGFTSLDKAYLSQLFQGLSEAECLRLITPPPSVLNAYFAETYEKQGPEAATAYFFQVSQALGLFQTAPSFEEKKPFIRLNLLGKSYGFCYENDQEVAVVFPEIAEQMTDIDLLELAQIFPHYQVYQEKGKIKMSPLCLEDEVVEVIVLDQSVSLLAEAHKLVSGAVRLSSFNRDDLLALIDHFPQRKPYYAYANRQFKVYLV